MDPGDADLKVPKHAVTVELALEGREPRKVELFVADYQAHTVNEEHVIDLLEQEAAFLPARDVKADAWVVFNKVTVAWVGLVPPKSNGGDGDELFEHRKFVQVEMLDGHTLRGELLYSAPEGRARVADYLNQPGRFFRLWTAAQLFLVNKTFVERVVEETPGAPRPKRLTVAPAARSK